MPHHKQTAVHLAIAIFLVTRTSAAFDVHDNRNGFIINVPDGFKRVQLEGLPPDILHVFADGDVNDEQPDIMLFIERMGGVIGREPLNPDQMPPGFTGSLFKAKWKSFEVDGFEVPESSGGKDFITFNVQIPIKPNAIQLKVFGPAEKSQELRQVVDAALADFDGETNWTPALSNSPNYAKILLATAVAIILIGIVAFYFVSRRYQRGAVLGVAVVIYLSGTMIREPEMREMMMLQGSLKMLGFIGIVLGIVDLVRRRNEKRPPRTTKDNDEK